MNKLQTKMLLLIGMGMLALLPAAQADMSNQRTKRLVARMSKEFSLICLTVEMPSSL